MYRVRNLTRNPVFVDSYEVFPPYTDVYVSAISPDIGNAQAKGHLMVTDLSAGGAGGPETDPTVTVTTFRGSLDINGSSTISLGAWTSVDCYVSFSSAVPVLHTTSVSDQLSPSLTVSGVFLVPLPDLGTGVSPSALTTVPASGAQFSIIVIGRR